MDSHMSRSVLRRLAIQRGEPMPTFGREVPPTRPAQPRHPHKVGVKSIRRLLLCKTCGRERRHRIDFVDQFHSNVFCCSCGTLWSDGRVDVPTDEALRELRIKHARAIWPSRRKPAGV